MKYFLAGSSTKRLDLKINSNVSLKITTHFYKIMCLLCNPQIKYDGGQCPLRELLFTI